MGRGLPVTYDEFAGGEVVRHRIVTDLYAEVFGILGFGPAGRGSSDTNLFAQALEYLGKIGETGRSVALRLPQGLHFLVDLDALPLPTNVHWTGGGRLVTTATGTGNNGAFLTGERITAVTLAGIEFEAPDDSVTAVRILSATDIEISRCRFIEATILGANNNDIPYANVDTSTNGNVCRDIRVIGNRGKRSVTSVSAHAGILPLYTVGGVIADNRLVGYHQGIQWWGGNANPAADGALANERKCADLAITGNVVTGSLEGGIWGSMGKHITVSGNVVNGAGDVAVDFEGCTNCAATGNVITGATNGALTTFFECSGIDFTGNACTTSVANGLLARLQNGSGLPIPRGIRFTNNTFTCLSGVGYVWMETAEDFSFSDNTLRNCAILTRTNNQKRNTVKGNTMTFDAVASAAFAAIDAGYNNLHGRLRIVDNTITSTVTQPAGSKGIFEDQFDDNNSPLVLIEGNHVSAGFDVSIEVRWAGPGPGVDVAKSLLRNNIFPVGQPPTVTEVGSLTSVVVVEGNRDEDLTPWP